MDFDEINHPSHYNQTTLQPIEVVETWGLGFHLGLVVKYLCRAGKKPGNSELKDLRKARWYLDRYIKLKESDENLSKPNP